MDISLSGVTKIYEQDIVALEDGVYLSVDSEFLYLGHDRLGKTTLLRPYRGVRPRGADKRGDRNLHQAPPV